MHGALAFGLAALFCSGLVAAQPGSQLCEEAGFPGDCLKFKGTPALDGERPVNTSAVKMGKSCPGDWRRLKQGDCWVETETFSGAKQWAYVHPKGWVVDPRCFQDKRFTPAELMVWLDSAWRKMSPSIGVAQGGCLSHFNPWWGKELVDVIFGKRIYLACPAFDPKSSSCAKHTEGAYVVNDQGSRVQLPDRINLVSFQNAARCIEPGGAGLAGVIFHETLHVAGADNFSIEAHNKAWALAQYVFVKDRVYAADAVCFFGTDPKRKQLVNILQCRSTVEYHAESPRQHLCAEFSSSFTDMPAAFNKH